MTCYRILVIFYRGKLMDRILVVTWLVFLACIAIVRAEEWKAPPSYVSASQSGSSLRK